MKTKRQAEGENIGPQDTEQQPVVTVRVLPRGDGLISTGEHDPAGGDLVYERGDTFDIAKDIAEDLEERGIAEIQETRRGPGRPPKAENASEEGA